MATLWRNPHVRRFVVGAALASVPFAVLGAFNPSFLPVALRSVNAMLKVAAITVGVGVWAVVLGRFKVRRWLDAVLIVAPVIPLAVFTLLPSLYNDREANRTLADAIANERPIPPPTTPTSSPDTTATSTTTTSTAPAQPVQLSTGSLRGIGHRASGQASLYRLPGGTVVIQFEGIDIEPGPDYDLYLVPGLDQESPGGGVHLGDLRANRGNDFYELPAGTSVEGELTVLVWCETFSVPIAAATQTPL